MRTVHRPPTDCLDIDFEARGDPLVLGDAGLEPFFDALEKHAGDWMPEEVSGIYNRKYSRAAALKGLKEFIRKVGHPAASFWRASPFVEMGVRIDAHPWPSQFSADVAIYPLSLMDDATRNENWSHNLLELVRAWSQAYPVTYARVHGGGDAFLTQWWENSPVDQGPELAPRERLQGIFWLNVLGKPWVDALGRKHVLSTPAHHLEELPNGAVLFLTRPTLRDWRSEEARRAQARAWVHLRPELDFDTVLKQLLIRSARFEPVAPRFDPDSAPFFKRVVERYGASEQPAKTAELNALQLPQIDEWLPAYAQLPSDVPHPEEFLQAYREWADVLSVMLHPDVQPSFKASPDALTDIDYRLWWETFPEFYDRELIDGRLFPSIGAYLGTLMLRHLGTSSGGHWVPRQNLLQTQVVIGDRAYLPFLRAQRYLRSTKSLLEYSLTRFFRSAQRFHSG